MKQEKKFVPDEVIGNIEVKGKTYTLMQGSKGGKYYINDKKKKVYVRETANKKPKVVTETKVIDVRKRKKFICTFNQLDANGEIIDSFNEWCSALNELEARQKFESEYANSLERGTVEICSIHESSEEL